MSYNADKSEQAAITANAAVKVIEWALSNLDTIAYMAMKRQGSS